MTGFTSCANKGFHINFPNGVSVSVQFGSVNYCDNRNTPKPPLEQYNYSCPNAEVLISYNDNHITQHSPIKDPYDVVTGFCTPTDVLTALNWAASRTPKQLESYINPKTPKEQ